SEGGFYMRGHLGGRVVEVGGGSPVQLRLPRHLNTEHLGPPTLPLLRQEQELREPRVLREVEDAGEPDNPQPRERVLELRVEGAACPLRWIVTDEARG